MPVRTSAVGAKFGPSVVHVSVRRVLAYAACIGDTGDASFDDARTDGIVAAPPFCVSLEWPVARSGPASNPLGAEAHELVRGVHAVQDSIFHRPIRPGDELQTVGTLVEVRPTRAGALVRTKLETREVGDGALVVTSWSTAIYRDVEVEGEASVLEAAPALPEGELEVGESVEIPIAREAPHVYTEGAQIWNPIHTERVVALAAGLPDIILHGTATWALASREIVRRCAGGDPTRLARLHGRFAAMVIPGTAIAVELGKARDGVVCFRVRNAEGELAIRDGVALLRG